MSQSTKSALPAFVVVFLDMMAFGLLLPSLPFLNIEIGGDATFLGAIVASFSVGQFVGSPLWGGYSDRVGRRKVLLITVALGALFNAIYVVSPTPFWLLVSRLGAGFAAGNLSVARALIADVTPPEKRTAAMGLVGAAFGLGFTFGPAIGALMSPFGLRAPGIVAIVLNVLNLIYIVQRSPNDRPITSSQRGKFVPSNRAAVLGVILVYLAAISGFAGFETVGALVTHEMFAWGHRENGYLFACAGLLSAFIQGGIVRRISAPDSLLIGFGYSLMALGFVGLTLIGPSVVHFILASAMVGAGLSFAQPSLFSLYSKLATDEQHGAAMGWLHAGGSMARFGGPLLAGVLFDAGGRSLVFGTSSSLLAVAFILFIGTLVLTFPQGKRYV